MVCQLIACRPSTGEHYIFLEWRHPTNRDPRTKHVFIQANCLPKMKKDSIYKLFLSLDLNTSDIISADCGCPARKGSCAGCKHVGALCYALEFSRLGKLSELLTCTEKLQEWSRP